MHVMVDLETLATSTDTIVLSLGACKFNIEDFSIEGTFYRVLDMKTQIDMGRKVDPGTLGFWLKQDPEVMRSLFRESIYQGISPDQCFAEFSDWLYDDEKLEGVWSNGSNFDIAILDHLWSHKEDKLWPHTKIRDVRTLVHAARGFVSKKDIPREGIAHHALDDAVYQAKYISEMWQVLRRDG